MKILIIGGVAAGTKVAAKLKREDRDAEVTILVKEKEISYAGCGLPYYVGGVIEERAKLIVNTPEKFAALTGSRVITCKEACNVDRIAKTVTAQDTESGEEDTYSYDKLVITVGARALVPPVSGTNLKNVFVMRKPEDADALRSAAENGSIKRAVVCGAGFIGLEVAENLAARGIKVSVIDMMEQILPGFDTEMASFAERSLADHGISCFTGMKLEEIIGTDTVEKIKTDRRTMKADCVVLALGIRPNTEFLAESGIEMTPRGLIKVDSSMRTNDENIYAAGDCVTVANRITKTAVWSPMGSSANIEGRLLAQVLTGEKKRYEGVLGTGVCKLPELNVGRTGLTETAAKEAGYDVISVVAVVDDKAHYYPGASLFIIKMTACRSTEKLLGVQVLGRGSVDKIVDTAAVAITMNASLSDIENIDLAYAPPFSTAIHPLLNAVNILQNKISGRMSSMTPLEYVSGAAEGFRQIDASIIHTLTDLPYIDLTKINAPIPGYALDEKLLLICQKGKRAYLTQNIMRHYGYTATKILEGGHIFNEITHKENLN